MRPATTARVALAAAALPVVFGLVAVRPAVAQTPVYDSYSLTALASGVRTAGDVGASGGLATLDTGSAQVSARLDSSPSAAVLAAPYEPGTLFRTGVGQVNAGAGQTVLDVPDAEAQFPGAQTAGELETVPPAEGGPVSSRGGEASAKAAERSVSGSATGERLVIAGALEVGASTTSVEMVADPDKGLITAVARTTVSRVLVGVLELRDVVAVAEVTTKGDVHTPKATLTVGGASVGGQGVSIDEQGVTAVGTTLVPGQTVQGLTDQANAALKAAGIQVTTVGTTETSTARDATADTGGVAIRLVTPDLPNGIAGNRLDVVVGGAVLTETDALALPVLAPLPVVNLPPTDVSAVLPPTTTTTTVLPGTPGIPGTPGTVPAETGPVVAAPPTAPAGLFVAGRRMPAAVALAAFAVWQFLSLGTATLYAVVDRRRRATLAEALA